MFCSDCSKEQDHEFDERLHGETRVARSGRRVHRDGLEEARRQDGCHSRVGTGLPQLTSDDNYVCGLWKDSLSHDTMWYSIKEYQSYTNTPNTRLSKYLTPSWSWRSTTGRVAHFGGLTTLREFQVVNVDIKTTVNDFGHIQDASIRVRGEVVGVRALPGNRLGHAPFNASDAIEHTLWFSFYWDSPALRPECTPPRWTESMGNGLRVLLVAVKGNAKHAMVLQRSIYRMDGWKRVGYAYVGAVTPSRRRQISRERARQQYDSSDHDVSSGGDVSESDPWNKKTAQLMELSI